MTISVAIYLFPGVEVLDFAGPYEVFTTANRVFERQQSTKNKVFNVFTVSRNPGLLRARAGLAVLPDFCLTDHPDIQILIVPGGIVNDELSLPELTKWITKVHEQSLLTASVCTGAFLLGIAGILNGKEATTHWEDIEDLRAMFPLITVLEKRRWIDQGKIVTSAGISAGVDMSLHLVERFAGRTLAEATAKQMEVDWPNLE